MPMCITPSRSPPTFFSAPPFPSPPSPSRTIKDEYALRSHTLARDAFEAGKLKDIEPTYSPQTKGFVTRDNGVRVGTMDKLEKLKPAFVKPHGTITAANASYLTDGAWMLKLAEGGSGGWDREVREGDERGGGTFATEKALQGSNCVRHLHGIRTKSASLFISSSSSFLVHASACPFLP